MQPGTAEAPWGERVPETVRGLVPRTISTAVTDPGDPSNRALPAELAGLPKVADRRLRDFRAGRTAARRALAGLGAGAAPVPIGPGGAPVWPDGFTGSIAHCARTCVAAVGRRTEWRSIGVDVEEDLPLETDLLTTVCTPVERGWLAGFPANTAGRLAMTIFSAKESAYKCQYPLTGALIGFDVFDVAIDLAKGQFTATFTCKVGRFSAGDQLQGRFAPGAGIIATVVLLPA